MCYVISSILADPCAFNLAEYLDFTITTSNTIRKGIEIRRLSTLFEEP